jgi:hypothetical protein
MELHCFISADYWHYARTHIREKLGHNVFILPICGAAGDQNPIDLVQVSKENGKELIEWNAQAGEVWCNYDLEQTCDETGERIADAVIRGYRKARNTIRHQMVFKHDVLSVELPIRVVAQADYQKAYSEIEAARQLFSPGHRMTSADQVKLFEPIGIIRRWKLQQIVGTYCFQSNFIRIGDAVFASNPFELFVEYALRIRARSKSHHNFIMQLTNGIGGYLPTDLAVKGGSYSSKPASTMVGPESGTVFAGFSIKIINSLMQD